MSRSTIRVAVDGATSRAAASPRRFVWPASSTTSIRNCGRVIPPASAIDLAETYLHLEGGGHAMTMPLTPAFWPTLISGKGDDAGAQYLRAAAPGWLVGIFS